MGVFTGALASAGVSAVTKITPVLMAEGGKFDIKQFFNNLANYLKDVGHYLMVFFGVCMIIVAVYQIFKGLAGGGRGQVNWVMTIGCLLVGGMLVAGGWKLAADLASMGKDTVEELAGGDYESEIGEDGLSYSTGELRGGSGSGAGAGG